MKPMQNAIIAILIMVSIVAHAGTPEDAPFTATHTIAMTIRGEQEPVIGDLQLTPLGDPAALTKPREDGSVTEHGESTVSRSESDDNDLPDATQYLYRIQPTRPEMLTSGPTPEETEIVSEHFEYLKQLTEQGVVVLAGRTLNTDASSFGIVIFCADSEEAARAIMNNDPAVQRRVMRAELFPYRIALMTAGK